MEQTQPHLDGEPHTSSLINTGDQPSIINTTTDNTQPNGSQDASDLPPAALDLATRLFDLARQGETTQLQQYISAGIPANLTNHKGDSLLMLAAYHGHAETATMLMQEGADVDALNDRGQSPLAGAVFKGYDEVVRTLFDRGADVHAGQPNAVDSARMFQRAEYLRLFGVEVSS